MWLAIIIFATVWVVLVGYSCLAIAADADIEMERAARAAHPTGRRPSC